MATRKPVSESPTEGLRRRFRLHPAQVVVVGFAGAIAAGTVLLLLPGMTAPGRTTTPVDAFFTAASAVTTTGLAAVDTATHWTFLGQLLIIVMTQLGGLGILVSAALIGVLLARRLSLRTRLNAANEFRAEGFTDLRKLVRTVVGITLLIEAVVALLLFLRYLTHYGWDVGRAAWNGIFDSISAFTNLGFSLQSDSMMQFVGDPFVCLPLCAGVILGGLGFPVIVQLWKEWRRPLHWSMNTNLVVFGTVALLLLGAAYLTFVEWDNPGTLGPLDPATRVLAGFFASVMTRVGRLQLGRHRGDARRAAGSPGTCSCSSAPDRRASAAASGSTTFFVLFFVMRRRVPRRGQREHLRQAALARRAPPGDHRRARQRRRGGGADAAAAAAHRVPARTRPLRGRSRRSAPPASRRASRPTCPTRPKVVLGVLMLVGRVGPLTLGTALILRDRRILYEFPKERPVIG